VKIILNRKEKVMNAPENLRLDTKEINVPFTSTSDDDLVGSVATFFQVQPSQGVGDWTTRIVNTSTGEPTIAPPLLFSFQSLVSTSEIQRELEPYQKVTLIADLQQSDTELWQFYGNGVVFINEPSASKLRVQTEIKNQGQRLVITIDNVANNLELTELAFRYVASCMDVSNEGAGELKVYYSQDPGIKVGRGKL